MGKSFFTLFGGLRELDLERIGTNDAVLLATYT